MGSFDRMIIIFFELFLKQGTPHLKFGAHLRHEVRAQDAVSKAGMVALSRSIARGFGGDGVKSFVVAPGFTRTDMAQDFIDLYGETHALHDIALDRLTEPDDIAPIVVLFASGLADHATGSTVDVNAASYVR